VWITFVQNHPIISSMIQFALLGTIGELIGLAIRNRKWGRVPWIRILGKAAIWAILAIGIKYAFVGFEGFVVALRVQEFLPDAILPFWISFFMNLLFGPWLILGHRLLDNLLERKQNWQGIRGALFTLLWFWIPAHTITFLLPPEWRITLAALWSIVLGLIMGISRRKKHENVDG